MLDSEPDLDIERGFGIAFDRPDKNVFCPFCGEAEGTSKSPSCSVSINGCFSCKSCKKRGFVTDFYAQKHGITRRQAQDQLILRDGAARASLKDKTADIKKRYHHGPHQSSLTEDIVEICCDTLSSTAKWIAYLLTERGLSYETVVRYNLGCDEYRITIPVYCSGSVANIRRYLPGGKPKMVNHRMGDSRPALYPESVLESLEPGDRLIICEGEFDCLLLNQHGFKAITNTGNAGVWFEEWTDLLVGMCSDYPITIMYDVNDKKEDYGQRMALGVARKLADRGLVVSIARLPIEKVGGDVTDWFMEFKRTREDLEKVIEAAAGQQVNPNEITDAMIDRDGDDAQDEDDNAAVVDQDIITLSEAALAKYFYRPVKLRAMVAGKVDSPYIVPRKVVVRHKKDDVEEVLDREYKSLDPLIPQLINCTAEEQKRIIKMSVGLAPSAKANIFVSETQNVEELTLIPTVDYSTDQGPYTVRRAYVVNGSPEANKVYILSGITIPDPGDQKATHLINRIEPAELDIDRCTLSESDNADLRRTFGSGDVHEKLLDIADNLSQHVTKIYGRPDLHVLVDLAFHAPLQFSFDGELLKKGWLEVLVLGDTRTGKGSVTEGLSRYYRAGEVVSGECMSMAGLVGGLQKMGSERWQLMWGKIPLNDRRLVILDEASGLTVQEIGALSRVRSEGIAEINKVISKSTSARTRLIWLSNARSMQNDGSNAISGYSPGILAVKDLIGKDEDIARFDMVLMVAKSEVQSGDINKHHEVTGDLRYTAGACQKLLTWAWSRRPEHVIFKENVVELAYKASRALGAEFSAAIPLIQGEDIRFKLARIAAAAAARTFSTDDGEHLIVKKDHMTFAYNFIRHIYMKPCCGYDQLSANRRDDEEITDQKKVMLTMRQASGPIGDLVDDLLNIRRFTMKDWNELVGLDMWGGQAMLRELRSLKALRKENTVYTITASFRRFLVKLKEELNPDQFTTEEQEAT